MYFKGEQISGKFTPGSDERIIGKINLRNGLLALITGIGLITVIFLFLSYGHPVPAAISGGIAGILLVLIYSIRPGFCGKSPRTMKWTTGVSSPENFSL